MHALLCIGVESYESFNKLLFLPATLQGDNNCSRESVALFKGVFSSLFVNVIGITVPSSFPFSGTFGTGGFRDFAYTSNPLGKKEKEKKKVSVLYCIAVDRTCQNDKKFDASSEMYSLGDIRKIRLPPFLRQIRQVEVEIYPE